MGLKGSYPAPSILWEGRCKKKKDEGHREAQEYAVTVRQPRTQDGPTCSSRKFHARGLLQNAPLHVPILMNPPASHRIWPLNGVRRWSKLQRARVIRSCASEEPRLIVCGRPVPICHKWPVQHAGAPHSGHPSRHKCLTELCARDLRQRHRKRILGGGRRPASPQ